MMQEPISGPAADDAGLLDLGSVMGPVRQGEVVEVEALCVFGGKRAALCA